MILDTTEIAKDCSKLFLQPTGVSNLTITNNNNGGYLSTRRCNEHITKVSSMYSSTAIVSIHI